MDLEELRKEARKHGYRLYKDYKYERLKPCPECGNNRRDHFKSIQKENGSKCIKYGMKCTKCGFSVIDPNHRKLHNIWNKIAEKGLNGTKK